MDAKLIEIEAPRKYLSVNWQVNNFCNYECSYCNPGNWMGDSRNEGNLDLYISNLKKIIDRYVNAGYFNYKFFFSGGEPTAWKNLIPICEWLKENSPECTIAVNTNLSRPLNWWKKHVHLFDDIVASFHVEFANKDAYEEKSIWLCDKVNYLSSKMLMHDERFWEVAEYGERLKKSMPNYFIEWTPLFNEMTVEAKPWHYDDPEKQAFLANHTCEMQQKIDKPYRPNNCVSYAHYDDGYAEPCNSNDIIVKNANFFQGWECDIGDAVFINPIGNISMASCGQAGAKIGHILEDVSKVGPLTITCDKYHCHCGTDIIIPKRQQHTVDEKDVIYKSNH